MAPQTTSTPDDNSLNISLGDLIYDSVKELEELHTSLVRLDESDRISLSDWEARFVGSCLGQHDRHRPWSTKQIDTLKQLLSKYGF